MNAKVAIIGAGRCGLSAAHSLDRHQIPWTAFERASETGGQWDDASHQAALSKTPRSRSGSSFLHTYADSYDLLRSVRFNTEITVVTPSAALDSWTLRWTDPNGTTQSEQFTDVIVATGAPAAGAAAAEARGLAPAAHYPFLEREMLTPPGHTAGIFLDIVAPHRGLFVLRPNEAHRDSWDGRHEQAELVATYLEAHHQRPHLAQAFEAQIARHYLPGANRRRLFQRQPAHLRGPAQRRAAVLDAIAALTAPAQ